MTRIKASIDSALKVACVAFFALLVLLVSWQVITRLVFNDPSVWSEEAARYTFIWASLLGIALATGERSDVAIDFLVRKLPVVAQRWVTALAYLTSIAFATLIMVWGGWLNVDLAWNQANPVLPVNQGVLYLAVPIAGALMAFYLLYHVVRIVAAKESPAVPEGNQVEL